MSVTSTAPSVGRFTALVLGLVVFVCVAMIGGTGFLKYRLDQAETVLAAPDNIPGSAQDVYGKLRALWGYGGFLGFAQKYVSLHDVSGFTEVKDQIKAADDIVAHLPNGTLDETRRELAVMTTLFDAALQKINAPVGGASAVEFTSSDLAPLYAAMPVLDARINAGKADARLAAQKNAQFWSMLLTLATWGSLIVTAACIVGMYQVLRDKRSAPMRALAQSIQNMAQGDMRTAIWGIERQDTIGEVARAIDIARYQFSHLPDISVLSEQGPVRMRFEGGSRSLFEAMMKAISTDSENIRQQSNSLATTIAQQKESISALGAKVENVLNNIVQRGQNGDQQIKLAITEMVVSAENLKNAHAHASDQLSRLIPNLQEKADGLAEITHATGKQLSHTLQSLTSSEIGLKVNAEQAKVTLAKLSSTADDLGERLFGAINLLQASGKVLAETTDNIKSRWADASASMPMQERSLAPVSEALEYISKHLDTLQDKLDTQAAVQQSMPEAPAEISLAPIASQLAQISLQLSSVQNQLDEQACVQSEREATSAADQNAGDRKDGFAQALSDLSEKITGLLASLPADLRRNWQEDLQPLAAQKDIALLEEKIKELAELNARACVFTSAIPGDLRQTLREAMADIAEKNDTAELVTLIAAMKADLSIAQGSSPDLTKQIGELGSSLASQVEASHAQIDATLRQEIATKLSDFERMLATTQSLVETTKEAVSKPPAPQALILPPELKDQLLDQWFQVSAQIEASRNSVISSLSTQMIQMESTLEGKPQASQQKAVGDLSMEMQVEKQTQILTELVTTLSLLDSSVQQIKAELTAAG